MTVRASVGVSDTYAWPTVVPPIQLPPLKSVDLSLWVDSDPPPRDWLVPDLIPYGCVTALYGDGGAGKTLLALDLMVAMASRGDAHWLDQDVHGWRSVGLFAEDDEPELIRRLKRVAAGKGVGFAEVASHVTAISGIGVDVTLAHPAETGEIVPTPTLAALVERVGAEGAGLLVVDYAAAVFGGNELDRYQVSEFMRLLNRIARDQGIAILLLGHPSMEGMRGGRGTSGSTAWRNQARSFLHLTLNDTQDDPDARSLLTLAHTKSNYSATGRSFVLASDGGGFEVIQAETRARAAERGPRLSPSQKVALKALAKAIEASGVPSLGVGMPEGVKIVRESVWREVAYSMGVTQSEGGDARRKAFGRAAQELTAKGLIGRQEPFVWLQPEAGQ